MSDWECIRHVVIRGRVQAVGYRAFTEYTALDQDQGSADDLELRHSSERFSVLPTE